MRSGNDRKITVCFCRELACLGACAVQHEFVGSRNSVRYQDQIVKQTQRALDSVLRAVEALPEDKRDWKPEETSRSALNQLQEIAMAPGMFVELIEEGSVPEFDDHALQERERIRQGIDTFEKCREASMEGTSRICQVISEFPDERLEDEVTLPFGGGMVMTMADVLGLHAWNLTYHLGQINYIQTMLGDLEMH